MEGQDGGQWLGWLNQGPVHLVQGVPRVLSSAAAWGHTAQAGEHDEYSCSFGQFWAAAVSTQPLWAQISGLIYPLRVHPRPYRH